ncbi:dienelactone hydrolase family protein [Arsukibacterium perlucidum]|uniref:dienelactone hydrolase family protein n=1 Tax=Arsukibacterium perlucidum TaxID=368811 RepID=UPI00036669E3|nr:dienelactone hydrolase family protein [Arsukibacterium perlucidum]
MPRHITIITDIFGLCSGVERLSQDLAGEYTITLIDPYQQQPQSFSNEQQAYATYCQSCGHDRYVSQVVSAIQQPVELAIGFSAGASALWRALSSSAAANVKQAVLFYPGQIYQHLQLTPDIPTTIIFGASEPHFEVDSMLQLLSDKPTVSAVKTPYKHGFMNPSSEAFSEAGYQHYLNTLKDRVGLLLLNTPTNTAATTPEIQQNR